MLKNERTLGVNIKKGVNGFIISTWSDEQEDITYVATTAAKAKKVLLSIVNGLFAEENKNVD